MRKKLQRGRRFRGNFMKLSELKVLIVEDDGGKYSDIKSALQACGIRNILSASNQEEGFEIIYKAISENASIGLIVTDMNYPLREYAPDDAEAGSKLIKRLKKEFLDIPVIVCSSDPYHIEDVLGCVWYSKLRDLYMDFKTILQGLM